MVTHLLCVCDGRHMGHELLKVRVGLPVEHDPSWMGPVCWRWVGCHARAGLPELKAATNMGLTYYTATALQVLQHQHAAALSAGGSGPAGSACSSRCRPGEAIQGGGSSSLRRLEVCATESTRQPSNAPQHERRPHVRGAPQLAPQAAAVLPVAQSGSLVRQQSHATVDVSARTPPSR